MNWQVKIGYCWKEIVIMALVIGIFVYFWTKSINSNIVWLSNDISKIETNLSEKATQRNILLKEISGKLDKLHVIIEIAEAEEEK